MSQSKPTYRSTRSSNTNENISFESAIMKGLAKDGGLFIPSSIPTITAQDLKKWSTLSFVDLAFEIMKLYISEDDIPAENLHEIISRSYSTFRSNEVTPLVKGLESNIHILELFHGPTYAFKDVALQFVGNLFEYFLNKHNSANPAEIKKLTIVGATSGDTGSAAIYGLRGKENIRVFILYPNGRISKIQEEQMTTIQDKNVQTLSVTGTFDNCQDIVKEIFGDEEFNGKYNLGAVNSINWARILAQITYYFYSYFQITNAQKDAKVKFVVPSGNFGDILAGFFAAKMGMPVEKLVIATNENDILDRFLKSENGEYSRSDDVKATLSPAMDILISSNFERLLWFLAYEQLADEDSDKAGDILNQWFKDLKTNGKFEAGSSVVKAASKLFDSESVTDLEILQSIAKVYQNSKNPNKYIVDPHTAVGMKATYNQLAKDGLESNIQYICLSTAHPAKFADAVNKSLESFEGYSFDKDVLPEELRKLSILPKKLKLVSRADISLIKAAIDEEIIVMEQ
ncbi:hypothetical protein QEN19_003688 [Hanseniaspora menglaensis]